MQCNCLKYNYLIFRTPIMKTKHHSKLILVVLLITFCMTWKKKEKPMLDVNSENMVYKNNQDEICDVGGCHK